jgi:hypothetical protein
MKLTFSDVRFRNRVIEFDPLKLWRPVTVRSRPITFGANTRGPAGRDTHALVRSDARGAARVPADVVFAHNANELIATVRVQDPKVAVAEKTPVAANDQAGLLKRQHLRLVIADSKQTFTFVVSPGGERGDARNGDWAFDESRWSATSHRQGDAWLVTFTVPRERLGDLGRLRVNLVHANPTADVEDCLSPTFDAGSDPDRVPDFRFGDRSTDQFAKLVVD